MSTEPGLVVTENGPIEVRGNVPIARQVVQRDGDGNAVGWTVTEEYEPKESHWLCRCGQSGNKPFCDGSHKDGFQATDSKPKPYEESASEVRSADPTIYDDRSICVHAQFCIARSDEGKFSVWKPGDGSDPEATSARLVEMVEHCPSGALSIPGSVGGGPRVGVVEHGPYAVTGGIPITLPDGTILEVRDRVTLCRCGQSDTKPLCDGSHDAAGFRDPE